MDIDISSPVSDRNGKLIYATAVFLISINQAVSKLMVESLNTFVVMQIRMAVTLSICCWVLRREKYMFWGDYENRKLLFTRGILGFVGLCCTYYGLRYLSLPDKAALAFLVPLATIFSARLLISEPLHWNHVFFSFIALCGVALIARPPILFGIVTEEHRMRAVLASLVFVVVTSLGILILRRLTDVHPVAPVGNFAAISFVCASIISFTGDYSYPKEPRSWALLALTGVLGFLIQFLETKALQQTSASVLVNLRYTQLIWATLWEWVIWGDLPDFYTVVGSLIVVGSVWYLQSKP